jgi:hypothetical protein
VHSLGPGPAFVNCYRTQAAASLRSRMRGVVDLGWGVKHPRPTRLSHFRSTPCYLINDPTEKSKRIAHLLERDDVLTGVQTVVRKPKGVQIACRKSVRVEVPAFVVKPIEAFIRAAVPCVNRSVPSARRAESSPCHSAATQLSIWRSVLK